MTPAEAIARARATWHDEGTLEIDDDAEESVSVSDGGAWVAAWVWVPDEEPEEPIGSEMCGWCGQSDRIIDHIDGDGRAVCTRCVQDEEAEWESA